MRSDYEKRMLRVLQYIHDHPDGDLSLDALADVAAMSRFHWHRVFHAMTGETCAQAVRRIRLNRAACWLTQSDWPVSEIAARVGYPSTQSFGRAFKSAFGMAPAAFRKTGTGAPPQLLSRRKGKPMFDIEIRSVPARRLAAFAHRGPYINIGSAFERGGAIIGARDLWHQVRGMVGVYLDDPSAVPEEELRSWAGFELGEDAALPEGFEEVHISAGPAAVLHFKGPYGGLSRGYDALYCDWLPASGRDPGDAPAYEVYLNSPSEVAPTDLLTDIHLPLKP